jgi:hypothetical protein
MGYDLYGWVEKQLGSTWYGVLDMQWFVDRRDPLIEFLFGPETFADFVVAPDRGLPPDVSSLTRQALERLREEQRPIVHESWLSWTEFCAIDPRTPCPPAGVAPYLIRRGAEDEPRVGPIPTEQFVALTGQSWESVWAEASGDRALVGREWPHSEGKVRIEYLSVADQRTDDGPRGWAPVFTAMEFLSGYQPTEHVRLVIWCVP